MYNSITESKIKSIPKIGDIDIQRLPQELTKIYAQIVSYRRLFIEGSYGDKIEELEKSLKDLQIIANNLETILIVFPNHENKESIAFVAATAHNLIHKMYFSIEEDLVIDIQIDSIPSIISCILLFLIGNSQADAAEVSKDLFKYKQNSITKQKLVDYVEALSKGNLNIIIKNPFYENEISTEDLQERALEYLWKELGDGIFKMALSLLGEVSEYENLCFDRVIEYAQDENSFFSQKSILSGPFHLAKLLKILEVDIFKRSVLNSSIPKDIDPLLWYDFLKVLAKERPFLWENHYEAVNSIFLDEGVSSVLTFPTGSGKSTLSELKIASCLFREKKVVYLVPTHALEDQINKNLKLLFSDFKPILNDFDGEYTEFGEYEGSSLLVMTPERCLTLLNINEEFFNEVGLVVFDEFHLIHGTDINHDKRSLDAMLCLLSLFKTIPNSDYLLISAMVENGEEIREWIEKVTERNCLLFDSSWKPTRQLLGCLIYQEEEIKSLNNIIKTTRKKIKNKTAPVILQKQMEIMPYCFFSMRNIWESVEESDYYTSSILGNKVNLAIGTYWNLTANRNEIAASLGAHFGSMGLKTLIFADIPRNAISIANKINSNLEGNSKALKRFIDKKSNEISSLSAELGSLDFSYFGQSDTVGIHHGLLLPIERNLMEEYFKLKEGSKVLVATATLAQGINLPAEIVIIAGDDRFNEDTGNRIRTSPHELLNAAGRAGRAGQSSQGLVIVIPGEIVTIKGSTISDRWWKLKEEVFSKSDQCLMIEDPLEYFLDSIQDDGVPLSYTQINLLYKFKPDNISTKETKSLLNNSFYAFKSSKEGKMDSFKDQVKNLIKKRNELDDESENIDWIKEISFKTGIDPMLILELGNSIDGDDFERILDFSILDFIDWFIKWLSKKEDRIVKVFTKPTTIENIKKVIGYEKNNENNLKEIANKLHVLQSLIIMYVNGESFEKINEAIPGKNDINQSKARIFIIRLIPEISFAFGILSMVIIEKAKQRGIEKDELSWSIRATSSCIKEGFDEIEKLNYKNKFNLISRVETHLKFNRNKSK
jgi:ATP-dependent RNA helicase DOB1